MRRKILLYQHLLYQAFQSSLFSMVVMVAAAGTMEGMLAGIMEAAVTMGEGLTILAEVHTVIEADTSVIRGVFFGAI
jgi:hypothetical protein